MENTSKSTKISFGKIDYYNIGRRTNLLELELELKKDDKHPCLEFSASGSVWNNLHTDIVMGGQCLDEPIILKQLHGNAKRVYDEIKDLWEKYHLNYCHAGTEAQTKLLKEHKEEISDSSGRYDYDKCVKFLKEHNMYEVELTEKEKQLNPTVESPYKYGHGWVATEIPEKDLDKINAIIDFANVYTTNRFSDEWYQSLNSVLKDIDRGMDTVEIDKDDEQEEVEYDT